jgi:hypothetical protein
MKIKGIEFRQYCIVLIVCFKYSISNIRLTEPYIP